LPIVETFHTTSLGDFTITNPDAGPTWTRGDVDGPTGAKTGVLYMGYLNYNAIGTTDGLLSPKFDISGYTNPTLMFDVSYAPYSTSFFDELAVLVSGDCGNSFDTLYLKGGTDLSTAGSSTSTFVPNSPSDWRTDTVALNQLNSNNVQFEIIGICGYGNNLYLDNIRVIDLSGTPSSATLNLPSMICEDEPFNFSLSSTDSTLAGNFSLNRSGSSIVNTFSGMGAHTSTLTSATDYYLEYVYYNQNTFVADSALLVPGPQLRPQFTLALTSGLTYNFKDNSTPAPTSWFWDFGDGTTSNQQNPQHTYATNGSFTVKLVVTTDCGVDSTITTFNNIGLYEEGTLPLVFYPNPTNEVLNIATSGDLGEGSIEIYSMIGTLLQRSTYAELSETVRLDLSGLPTGIYTVKVKSSAGTVSQNVSKL